MTEYGVSRYNNIGGYTCYMNSILAILQQMPIFTDYIVTGQFELSGKKEDIKKSLTFNLYKILKASLSNDNKVITANLFYKTVSMINPMWGERSHQDTQEFLGFLLNKIEEEISYKVDFLGGRNIKENTEIDTTHSIQNIIAKKQWERFVKNEFSPVKMMFTGLLNNKIKCDNCSYQSDNYDAFQCLQLNIPKKDNITLNDCLDYYIEEEQLDEDNMLYCDFCFQKNQSHKSNMIMKTPKILIIQLKRFKVNMYGQVCGKITDKVEYPVTKLDLSKYSNDTKNVYNLFAVNLHHPLGPFNSINFGHYTSIVKSRLDNKWYHFDDNSEIENIDDVNDLINENAYLLFYLREN